ncbi:MAG TPA: S-layer homology domain-containing protein [Firmicutes bacterium]|nr:S-layer homology domain-containing protein [Candidatus Fermentithermobacillaceae bacterium]
MKKGWLKFGAVVLAFVLVAALSAPQALAKGKKIKNALQVAEKMKESLKEQEQVRFKDWEQAQWALQHMARLRVKGIIEGDENGYFNPNRTMTQAEVLTMLARAFGYEDNAVEMDETFRNLYPWAKGSDDFDENEEEEGSFKVGDSVLPVVPKSVSWALGYILYAVDQGWVTLDELQPRKAASRAWVAMVMVRALGYEEEAQAKMNVTLPFKDANAIPADKVGYLAVAAELGLFQGTPEGMLYPLKPISRVEMAALIDKFFESEPIDLGPYEVKGTVTEVVYTGFTVSTASGETFTFTFSPDAVVISGKNPASLEDLQVGQKVHVLANADGVALFIKICIDDEDGGENDGEDEGRTIEGTISAIHREDDKWTIGVTLASGDEVTVKLHGDVEILFEGTTLTADDLLIGDVVVVTLRDDDEAELIEVVTRGTAVPSEGEISGEVQEILVGDDGVSVAIKLADGRTETVRLAQNIRIKWGTEVLTPNDLAPGDKVVATIRARVATELRLVERAGQEAGQYLIGKIEEVSEDDGDVVLKVRDAEGNLHKVRLAAKARVMFGSKEIDPDELREGDTVRLRLQYALCVEVTVTARERAEERGD